MKVVHQNTQALVAHLALRLAQGPGLLQVVDLKPIPLAHGHRIHNLSLPKSAVEVGPLGASAGYALLGVMNERRPCELALRADFPVGYPLRQRPGDLGD